MELLLMIDAARGASAAQITAVMPHYAYARSDKKDASRISLGGRLVADMLATAGADRVLTMALHAPQVHGFFSVPVDHLTAIGVLADHFRGRDLTDTVVVSPDLGNAKTATQFARLLGLPVAAGSKQRAVRRQGRHRRDRRRRRRQAGHHPRRRDRDRAARSRAAGPAQGRRLHRGRRSSCTHGLFAGKAVERLRDHPFDHRGRHDRHRPAAGRLARAPGPLGRRPCSPRRSRRIHHGRSVSARSSRASTPPTRRRSRGSPSDPRITVTSPRGRVPVCPPASRFVVDVAFVLVFAARRAGPATRRVNAVVGALATAWPFLVGRGPSAGLVALAVAPVAALDGRPGRSRRGRRHRRRRHAAARPHRARATAPSFVAVATRGAGRPAGAAGAAVGGRGWPAAASRIRRLRGTGRCWRRCGSTGRARCRPCR